MKKKIVILSGNPLHNNPRVLKEATLLAKLGFCVKVLGGYSSLVGANEDKHLASYGGFQFETLYYPSSCLGIFHRLIQKFAKSIAPRSKWSFGLLPFLLRYHAIRFRPDLIIAHSEPALFAAWVLHKKGYKIAVDMEDWFSEDLPLVSRLGRPVEQLRLVQNFILNCAVFSTCTTEVMADALVKEYKCPRPTRIYNVFSKPKLKKPLEFSDRTPKSKSINGQSSLGTSVPSIHWFSQTIGPDRGLEILFGAAECIKGEFEIHLRGNLGTHKEWAKKIIPESIHGKVFFHAPVTNKELSLRIAEHDIGYAGESRFITNRNLTATNKIFQYIQSGLVVIASNTLGQLEIAKKLPKAIHLFESDQITSLHHTLQKLIDNNLEITEGKKNALLYEDILNWEKEAERLVGIIDIAFRPK